MLYCSILIFTMNNILSICTTSWAVMHRFVHYSPSARTIGNNGRSRSHF
ncbi:hypothetical protein CKO_04524 [Citrobacter koseri ATCC BAA-895]|uniref:Uncharacterized protein n=1 Tax=Citrobacter koseri (strain ATCC BAA-895 / CDC 4225-83 / SGSC4696) TaxID=290338 RepID=A8AQ16_CITK8|nr:hypothetical protein CKO_04524 [Citrobacter koseri ATCC BAA-895]